MLQKQILIFCPVFYLALASQVGGGGAGEQMLPPALTEALARHSYELINPEGTDHAASLLHRRQRSPFICAGDFQGTGKTEYAMLLRDALRGTLRLVIFSQVLFKNEQWAYYPHILRLFLLGGQELQVGRTGASLGLFLVCEDPGRKQYFEITRVSEGRFEKIKVKRKTIDIKNDSFRLESIPPEWSAFLKEGAAAELFYFQPFSYKSVPLTRPVGD